MALGFSAAQSDALLNTWATTALYVKLHTAAPGAAGTTAAATETTRKLVAWTTASGGTGISNTAALTWSSVAGTETYTHFSVWTTVGPAGGTFMGSGTVSGGAVLAGQTFVAAIGALTFTTNTAT